MYISIELLRSSFFLKREKEERRKKDKAELTGLIVKRFLDGWMDGWIEWGVAWLFRVKGTHGYACWLAGWLACLSWKLEHARILNVCSVYQSLLLGSLRRAVDD